MSRLDSLIRSTGKAAPKIVMYAPPGTGKSTFAASAGSLLIDCENGAGTIPGLIRTPYLEKWIDMRGWLEEAAANWKDTGARCLAVDTVDWMIRRIVEYVTIDLDKKAAGDITNTLGTAHGGYFKAREIVENVVQRQLLPILNQINNQGVPILLLAHAARQKITSIEGYDTMIATPDLPKEILPIFQEWADCILFGNVNEQGERIINTTPSNTFTAKNRYGLPPVLPMHWPTLVQHIRGQAVQSSEVKTAAQAA